MVLPRGSRTVLHAGERRFTCRPVHPREGAAHFVGDVVRSHCVVLCASAGALPAVPLAGTPHRTPPPVRACSTSSPLLTLAVVVPSVSDPAALRARPWYEDQPILPTLGLPAPSGVLCSPQVVCRCPTRRTSAGDTERPAWRAGGHSYLAEVWLLDRHLDNRRFDRPGDAVLQDRHTSRPAEALVHAKRRSTAIGMLFRTH